jgi:predicted small metal-binding protein
VARDRTRHDPFTEVTMQKVINCPCGFVVRGHTDDELVARAQEHARQVHQMELSREQALAMAKPT